MIIESQDMAAKRVYKQGRDNPAILSAAEVSSCERSMLFGPPAGWEGSHLSGAQLGGGQWRWWWGRDLTEGLTLPHYKHHKSCLCGSMYSIPSINICMHFICIIYFRFDD